MELERSRSVPAPRRRVSCLGNGNTLSTAFCTCRRPRPTASLPPPVLPSSVAPSLHILKCPLPSKNKKPNQLFMVGVPIILMNLFISVLSEVYPSEKARAERLYEDQITLASQDEHVKRTNPILKLSRPRNRILRLFHTILVRPTLERGVTFFSWLLPPDKNASFGKQKAFGWTLGNEQMTLHLAPPRRADLDAGNED